MVDEEEAPLYARSAREPKPWQISIANTAQQSTQCAVHARLFYPAGCEQQWRVDMQRVDDAWRLRGIQPL
jgi:hypothetical protein